MPSPKSTLCLDTRSVIRIRGIIIPKDWAVKADNRQLIYNYGPHANNLNYLGTSDCSNGIKVTVP